MTVRGGSAAFVAMNDARGAIRKRYRPGGMPAHTTNPTNGGATRRVYRFVNGTFAEVLVSQ
ncbi:hypothetical protein BSLA_03r0011 [Burkholderia stabilis]|nr:hypothetical protein BSLA_03r0011 [Burkholderia stabilis]